MINNECKVKIKVIGAGGAGGNAINDMIAEGVTGVEYIAANTDAQDLNNSLADIRIQLGEKLTKGLGAGANPEVGRLAAEEDIEKLKGLLEETDMLFITAGMGGGTGTGSAPVIAQIAKEMGVLTIGIVTKPFNFEGKKRGENAKTGLENLEKNVDSLVIIPNDKLFELPEKTITLQNAFKEANNILKIGIKGIADLMIGRGLINLDFADIKTTMQDTGIAVLGFGEGEGENRVTKATDKALSSPLLEKSIMGANKILINIAGSSNLGLFEAQTIADIIQEAAGKTADDIMFGITSDDSYGDKIQVTIIANSFEDEVVKKTESFINLEKNKIEVEVEKKERRDELDLPPWVRG